MRVLFVTWSAPGHLFPSVPMAWACRLAGHDVRYACPPAARPAIEAAGLPSAPVGNDVDLKKITNSERFRAWDEHRSWPAGWSGRPKVLSAEQTATLGAAAVRQLAVADAMLDELLTFAKSWQPNIVVHDPLCFAGPVVGQVLDVPSIAHGWELGTVLRSEMRDRGEAYLAGYRDLFERNGVAPRRASARLLDPSPPNTRLGDADDTVRLPVRYVAYNGPGATPMDLLGQTSRQRICVTGGVAIGKFDGDALANAVNDMFRLTKGLDAEIILAVAPGQGQAMSNLPDGVSIAEGVPFHLLLPHCAAVVHHGGAGTAMTAIATGTPQLILSQSPIYSEIGASVDKAGVGITMEASDSDDEMAATALKSLLTEQRYTDALRETHTEMADMPSPAEAVRAFLETAI